MIKEDYLIQDGYSIHDAYCPFYKTAWMLRNLVLFYELASKAVDKSAEKGTTWGHIKQSMRDLLYQLSKMKEQLPSNGEEWNVREFKRLNFDVFQAFKMLEEGL